ncbi:MAG: Smr/MutS family protein, partial [Clostridia bacterium]|nr:Smr/MutS family protein [Clostridia bacterium]
LDRFIDTQLRMGIEEFTVIHGKGTGVLRKEVGKYLSKNPHVKEYRLGTFGEGEDGVTIVKMK